MPILDVQLVGETEVPPDLARRIADAAAEVLGSSPQGTWVKLTALSREHYAENGGAPDGIRPVFVTVLRRDVPGRDRLKEEVRKLARAVASACGRPEANVHVIYQPPGIGRVALGGTLIE